MSDSVSSDMVSVPVSIRKVVTGSAWRDLKRFSAIFFMLTTCLGAWHSVRLRYGDVHDFFAYAGSTGPYALITDAAGQPAVGALRTEFRAGESVAWVSLFCINTGTAWTGHVALVRRVAEVESVIVGRDIPHSADILRCGPKTMSLMLPSDALPGNYVVRRSATFRDGAWWPLEAHFPDIKFIVEDSRP